MLLFNGVKRYAVFSPDGSDAGSGTVLGQAEVKPVETSTGSEPAKTEVNDDVTADEVDVRGGKYIPRSRFNEINERRKKTESEKKALEARVSELEKSSEGYNRLEGYLSTNPNLHKKVTSLIKDHAEGKITEAHLEKELGKLEDKVEASGAQPHPVDTVSARITENERKRNHTMYNNDLLSLAGKDFETEEDIADIGKRVTRILNSDYPNWNDNYHPGLVKKVYKEAIDELEGYHKKKMASYEKKKQSDGLPKKESSSGFQEDVDLDTTEKRKASLAQGLKTAFKGA